VVHVLKEIKKAIGWSLSNLKDISPSYYMHKILMEEEYQPIAQSKRHLNPSTKELMRKK